jgi:hypothetical protein
MTISVTGFPDNFFSYVEDEEMNFVIRYIGKRCHFNFCL